MKKVAVRRINEWDGPAMLKIYAPYTGTIQAPEEALPALSDYIQRIDRYTYGLGWLMCEIDSQPAGFCHLTEDILSPEDPFSVSVQVYVKEECQHMGVGTALLTLITDILNYGNRRNLTARVLLPNEPAIQFFEKQGFLSQLLEPTSFEKFGQKHDCMIMKKALCPVDPQAKKPTKPYLIENADYEAARERAALLVTPES